MGMSKDKIADILNSNWHLGIANWTYSETEFITPGHHPRYSLSFNEAESVAQGYFLDQAEKEAMESEDKPTEAEVIRRLQILKTSGSTLSNSGIKDIASIALDLISSLQHAVAICERDHGDKDSAVPSADEALAIINEQGHDDREWEIIAIDAEDSYNVLTYAELIGTAMFYKAKGAKA